MDYLTRKSIAISTGAVGTWLGGRGTPHLRAIGVRVGRDGTINRNEITEALDDLGLRHLFPSIELPVDEIERLLALAGTTTELKQLARGFLLGVAERSRKFSVDRNDPMINFANSASANFTPPDELKITYAEEITVCAEAKVVKPLLPPNGYRTWLAYAVATMDIRTLQNGHDYHNQPQWPKNVTREDIEAAAVAELEEARHHAQTDSTIEDQIRTMLAELYPNRITRHLWLNTCSPLCDGRTPNIWKNVLPDQLFLVLSVLPAAREVFRDDEAPIGDAHADPPTRGSWRMEHGNQSMSGPIKMTRARLLQIARGLREPRTGRQHPPEQ